MEKVRGGAKRGKEDIELLWPGGSGLQFREVEEHRDALILSAFEGSGILRAAETLVAYRSGGSWLSGVAATVWVSEPSVSALCLPCVLLFAPYCGSEMSQWNLRVLFGS